MTSTVTVPVEAEPDPRDPGLRLARLLDPGSGVALAPRDDSGAYAVRGRINGCPVTAFATDSRMLVVGLALPYSVRFLTNYRIPISGLSAIIAIIVSSLVGIIFGTVPATRASQLDPVESLRYE